MSEVAADRIDRAREMRELPPQERERLIAWGVLGGKVVDLRGKLRNLRPLRLVEATMGDEDSAA